MSFPNYQYHAEIFLKTINKHSITEDTSFFYAAKNYIKSNSDFKYKDKVEAGTLLSVIKEKGLIEFKGYNLDGAERYVLTEMGIEFFKGK